MKKYKRNTIITAAGMTLLVSFTVILNVLATSKFDNIFEKFFGSSESSLRGDTLGADVDYYKSDFNSPKELYTYEEKKVAEIVQEGITLFKNDNFSAINSILLSFCCILPFIPTKSFL